MRGSEYLLWSYGQFEKMTFSTGPPSTVLYRRIAMAIETASKVGSFFIVILLIVTQVAAAAILSE